MKNKIITLVVSLALVFTMSVPAFAADEPVTAKSVQDSVSYFAVGDSVAAGCKNLNFMWAAFDPSAGSTTDDHFFNEYNYFKNGKMNGDVYAVPFSFVYRVAEKLGASKASSFNGSYIGLRSKDVCQILGLPEAKAGDYANDQWSQTIDMFARMFNMSPEQLAKLTTYEELYQVSGLYDSPALKQQYVDGIKNADVITVELGENDLTAFLINHSDMIEQTFTDLTNGIEGIPGAAVLAGRFVEDFNAFATASDSSQKFEAAKKLNEDILLLVNYGVGYAEIVKHFADMINEMNLQGIYYTQELLNYINENKKDDAIVVVCTIIDPFKDMAVDSVASESLGVGALVKIMDLIVNPYSKLIGQNLKDHAFTNGVRNYYVADISGVSVNPAKEVLNPPYVDEAQEVEYLLHPSNAGQQQIADLILAQVAKAKKAAAKKERAELVKQVVKEEVDSYTKAAVMVGTTQLVKDSIQAQINAYVLKQAVEKAKKIHKVNKALLKAAVAKKVTKDVVRAAVVKQQVKKAVAKKVVKDTVKAVVKQQVKKAVAKKVVKDTAKAAVATAVTVKTTKAIVKHQVKKAVAKKVARDVTKAAVKTTKAVVKHEVKKAVAKKVAKDTVKATQAVVKYQVKKAVAKKVVKDTVKAAVKTTKAVVKQQVQKAVAKKVARDVTKAAVKTTQAVAKHQVQKAAVKQAVRNLTAVNTAILANAARKAVVRSTLRNLLGRRHLGFI